MYLQMNAFIVPPTAQPFEYLNPKTKIDFAAFVPLQVQKIVETNLLNRLAQIQNVIVGGAALHQTIEEQLVSLANRIFSTYGMTETVSHIALRRINGNSKSNAYQVLSGISTRQDERGCLAVKGEVTTDKWLQTNDIVQFDTPTSFQLLGRADNIINSGGIKVQPERLEQQIAPLLAKYGVFCRYAISSQPDEKLGEKIILVTESQLDTLIKQTLLKELPNFCPPYQQPKQIITVTEFPQTATDKIHRGKLKEILKSK
jgi:O-succinylbenzoic acid--CoA ligase